MTFANLAVSDSLLSLLISTAILIAAVLALRAVLGRFIRRSVASTDLRRRWMVQSRNGLLMLLLLGLIIIWGEELRTLALSIVAIAVAFVVATKELIMCVMGTILKTMSRSFEIGDRIQIKDFRGDVIDQNLLATTILEVGPGKFTHQRTGRTAVLPNAMFVGEPVINESLTQEFGFHVFTVPFKRDEDWPAAQQALLATANRYCQPYLEEVRRFMNRISVRRGLEIPAVDPRVTIQVPTAGEIHLVVRVPVRTRERSFIEQSILSDVFKRHDFSRKQDKEQAADGDGQARPSGSTGSHDA